MDPLSRSPPLGLSGGAQGCFAAGGCGPPALPPPLVCSYKKLFGGLAERVDVGLVSWQQTAGEGLVGSNRRLGWFASCYRRILFGRWVDAMAESSADLTVSALIEQVLHTLGTAMPPENEVLDGLFERLRQESDPNIAVELEQRIWASWCDHEEADGIREMSEVVRDFQGADLENASDRLDAMVARWPGWAEVWNKRATLRYLQERDVDSLSDINRTLVLEPRHFGAISGFSQICLRAGDETSALIGLEQTLAINPGMDQVREAAENLRKRAPRTVH